MDCQHLQDRITSKPQTVASYRKQENSMSKPVNEKEVNFLKQKLSQRSVTSVHVPWLSPSAKERKWNFLCSLILFRRTVSKLPMSILSTCPVLQCLAMRKRCSDFWLGPSDPVRCSFQLDAQERGAQSHSAPMTAGHMVQWENLNQSSENMIC